MNEWMNEWMYGALLLFFRYLARKEEATGSMGAYPQWNHGPELNRYLNSPPVKLCSTQMLRIACHLAHLNNASIEVLAKHTQSHFRWLRIQDPKDLLPSIKWKGVWQVTAHPITKFIEGEQARMNESSLFLWMYGLCKNKTDSIYM